LSYFLHNDVVTYRHIVSRLEAYHRSVSLAKMCITAMLRLISTNVFAILSGPRFV